MKNFFKVVFSRAVFTGVFIALQFAAIFLAVTRFNEHFALFYGICLVLSAIVVIYLVGRDGNPAYKIAWIIPILAAPLFGVTLYLMFGGHRLSRRMNPFEPQSPAFPVTLWVQAIDTAKRASKKAHKRHNTFSVCSDPQAINSHQPHPSISPAIFLFVSKHRPIFLADRNKHHFPNRAEPSSFPSSEEHFA